MPDLFREADNSNWKLNAVVNSVREDDSILAHGYQHALDAVVSDWQAGNRFDLVVPAVVLLGRHAIELALKSAIRVVEAEVARQTAKPVLEVERREQWMRRVARHDLSTLRNELERLLGELGEAGLSSEVNDVIDQLGEVDPAGDNFRYSTTWDGLAKSTTRTLRPAGDGGRVNVVALGRWMSEATTALLILQDVVTDGHPDR